MFEVAIQAVIGARIITRESVKARKNVLAKCYGRAMRRAQAARAEEGRSA